MGIEQIEINEQWAYGSKNPLIMNNLLNSSKLENMGSAFLALLAFLEPTVPFVAILFFAIMADMITAWDLAKRVKKLHPSRASGKFQSRFAHRIWDSFWKIYLVIVLVWVVETYILTFVHLYLTNICAAIFCAFQVFSMLENISSANGKPWAKIMQKVLVDKTTRHFDLNVLPIDDTRDNTYEDETPNVGC